MKNSPNLSGFDLFRRLDTPSQNTIALMVRDGALLQVNHLLGVVDGIEFIDEQFGSQMAGYGSGLEEITLRYYQ